MFLERKSQFCENDYTTQATYRFNTTPIKLPMTFFQRIRTKHFINCMETQKPPNSQTNLKKEKQS